MSNMPTNDKPTRADSLPVVSGETVTEPRRFWRSEADRAGRPNDPNDKIKAEFPAGADTMDAVSRRGFMQGLGVTSALAGVGAAGCYRPTQKIVPYVERPDESVPGNYLHFATGYTVEGFGRGLLVRSADGRPVKVDGNPEHPDVGGTSTSRDQGVLYSLYDDDRAVESRMPKAPASWLGLQRKLVSELAGWDKTGGAGLAFVYGQNASPHVQSIRANLAERFPNAKAYVYDALASDGARAASKASFGKVLEPGYRFDQAKVVAALDADFTSDGPDSLKNAAAFAAARKPGEAMNRLYAVEPHFTATSTLADHRLRVSGSDVAAFAGALVKALAGMAGMSSLQPLVSAAGVKTNGNIDAKWVTALAKDLVANKGQSLVVAGRRQSAFVHTAVNAINAALGNVGKTVTFGAPAETADKIGFGSLAPLVAAVDAGQVKTVVVTAENPVFGKLDSRKLWARLIPTTCPGTRTRQQNPPTTLCPRPTLWNPGVTGWPWMER